MTVNIAEYTGNVIKVGGQCYQFVGVVPDDGSAVTSDAVFATCEECAQESSAEEVSSAQEVSSAIEVSSAQEVSSEQAVSSAQAVANACIGVDCGAGAGPTGKKPSMQLTVTGGTGDVFWCGETWTEAQRGQTRCVCPGTWVYQPLAYITSAYQAYYMWQKRFFTYITTTIENNHLDLHRQFRTNSASTACQKITNFLQVNRELQTFTDFNRDIKEFCGGPVTLSSSLGVILGVAAPTKNDARFSTEPAFFGSVVVDGVTLTWKKGIDWPVPL